MDKMEETREFLQMVGMPKPQQADICCYVILAMAGIKADMNRECHKVVYFDDFVTFSYFNEIY